MIKLKSVASMAFALVLVVGCVTSKRPTVDTEPKGPTLDCQLLKVLPNTDPSDIKPHVPDDNRGPFVVVASGMYICPCIVETRIDGGIEQVRLDGATEEAGLGGATEEAASGGAAETSGVAGATEGSKLAGAAEDAGVQGETENTDLGGATEETEVQGDVERAGLAGATEASELGGNTEKADLGGATDGAGLGGTTEESRLGGATETLQCRVSSGPVGFELVDPRGVTYYYEEGLVYRLESDRLNLIE